MWICCNSSMPISETITGKGDGHTILYEFYVVLSWKGLPFHARMSLLEVYSNWRGDCMSFPVGSEAKTKDFPSRRRRRTVYGLLLWQYPRPALQNAPRNQFNEVSRLLMVGSAACIWYLLPSNLCWCRVLHGLSLFLGPFPRIRD